MTTRGGDIDERKLIPCDSTAANYPYSVLCLSSLFIMVTSIGGRGCRSHQILQEPGQITCPQDFYLLPVAAWRPALTGSYDDEFYWPPHRWHQYLFPWLAKLSCQVSPALHQKWRDLSTICERPYFAMNSSSSTLHVLGVLIAGSMQSTVYTREMVGRIAFQCFSNHAPSLFGRSSIDGSISCSAEKPQSHWERLNWY